MTCPNCGSNDTEVIKVISGPTSRRRRSCIRCKARWRTRETVEDGSLWIQGDPIPVGGRPRKTQAPENHAWKTR